MLIKTYDSILTVLGLSELNPLKKWELQVLLQRLYSKGLKDMLCMLEIEKEDD